MNESAASTTLKRIALFKVNKVPYLLEFNINWGAGTHLTRVWSNLGEMNWESRQWAKPLWGRGGGTQLFLKALLAFFFSTYKIILGIHTYIFHNRECDFLKCFFNMSPPSPPGFTPMCVYVYVCICVLLSLVHVL